MDINKLKDLSNEERQMVFESEAIGQEEASYMKPLSAEELAAERQRFADLAIQKAEIDDEFDKVKEDFKAKLKPLQLQISEALGNIKARGIWSKGLCYKIADYDNKLIHIVDDDGLLINSRMMRPDERQFRLTTNQKAS